MASRRRLHGRIEVLPSFTPDAPAGERPIGRKLLVRKGGFEPPRSCERQPLKLVRLPVPPLPRGAISIVDRGLRIADLATATRDSSRLKPAPTYIAFEQAEAGSYQNACYFFCAGGGAGVWAGALAGSRTPRITDPGPRCPMIASASAPTMNSTAQTVVARESTVAPLRAPNAV